MKTKYISAIVVLVSTLAIVRPCSAMVSTSPQLYPAMAPPAQEVPAGYVWNGTQYVGQVGGKYYYVGPQNTWLVLDKTRERSLEEWQRSHPNWMGNTRSTGPAMEQYPGGQPSQMGN